MRRVLLVGSIISVAALVALAPIPGCRNPAPQDEATLARWAETDFHGLSSETLAGEQFEFDAWRGKPVLVVNVASKCGLTPQYEGLQALYEEFGPQGLVIVGFPCNQFLGQEPGDPAEIAAFCSEEYGVSFPLMAKVEVKQGDGQSPIYGFLGTRTGELPSWNFAKYLVAKDGTTVRYFGPRTSPDDEDLRAVITAAL
jgi:glutathione peroxidase